MEEIKNSKAYKRLVSITKKAATRMALPGGVNEIGEMRQEQFRLESIIMFDFGIDHPTLNGMVVSEAYR